MLSGERILLSENGGKDGVGGGGGGAVSVAKHSCQPPPSPLMLYGSPHVPSAAQVGSQLGQRPTVPWSPASELQAIASPGASAAAAGQAETCLAPPGSVR